MYKTFKFIFSLGRRQAYREILSDLVSLRSSLPKTRESQLIGGDIQDLIDKLKADLAKEKEVI